MAAAAAQTEFLKVFIKDDKADKAANRQSTSELEADLKESQAMFTANRQVCEEEFGIHHSASLRSSGNVAWHSLQARALPSLTRATRWNRRLWQRPATRYSRSMENLDDVRL